MIYEDKITELIEGVINICFPRRCPYCHQVVSRPGLLICPECYRQVDAYYRIKEPACKKCGKSVLYQEQEYCYDCTMHKKSFTHGISLFSYGKRRVDTVELPHSMGESVHWFKYHNRREYAWFYAEELVKYHGETIGRFGPDVVVPVPLHSSRYRIRGYNQSLVLAKAIGKRLNLPVNDQILFRKKKTIPQKELNYQQRFQNMMEAIQAKRELPQGMGRVLLVDDIYTTGSTLEVCTRKLLGAGAQQVMVITVCSGQSQ